MPRFCLDTSALLTLRDHETGADRVAHVLDQPVRCLAYEQVRALPIDWLG